MPMVKITFIDDGGTARTVDAEPGANPCRALIQIGARDHDVIEFAAHGLRSPFYRNHLENERRGPARAGLGLARLEVAQDRLPLRGREAAQ